NGCAAFLALENPLAADVERKIRIAGCQRESAPVGRAKSEIQRRLEYDRFRQTHRQSVVACLKQCKVAYGRQAENRGSDDHKSLLAEVRAVAPMDTLPVSLAEAIVFQAPLDLAL